MASLVAQFLHGKSQVDLGVPGFGQSRSFVIKKVLGESWGTGSTVLSPGHFRRLKPGKVKKAE